MPELESLSPNTGLPISQWSEPEPIAVEAALDRLTATASGPLVDMAARRDRLGRVSAALAAGREELIALIVAEVGKTPDEATAEIDYAESFLATSRRLLDDYPFEIALDAGRLVQEVPPGLGLLIAPFNDPVAGLMRKIGPCLAAGTGALVKPSELAVLTAQLLARHMSAAGLDDAVAVLPLAARDRIAALIADDRVGTISFTGSTAAGRAVAVEAARHGTGYVGELGGTNPFVILADADLERAVADLVTRKVKAAGQACSAPNIVFVERPILPDLRERLAAALAAVAIGSSDAPGVRMGPVRHPAARARLEQTAAGLEAAGAIRLGAPPVAAGSTACLIAPAALEVATPAPFLEREMFGPLMGVCAFDDRTALRAVLAANRQPLVLYVYGRDREGVAALTRGLRYGSIGINTTGIQSPEAPTGGFREAGIGREGGPWGLSAFLTTVNRRTDWSRP